MFSVFWRVGARCSAKGTKTRSLRSGSGKSKKAAASFDSRLPFVMQSGFYFMKMLSRKAKRRSELSGVL